MGYTAEQKSTAVHILNQFGGLTADAITAVQSALNAPGLSKSTLHGWLKAGDKPVETKPNKPSNRTEPNQNRPKKSEPSNLRDEPPLDFGDIVVDGLTEKEQLFLNEYLRCWNATEAAKRAGYSEDTAYQSGYRLRHKPLIDQAIQQRLAEHTLSAEEAMARLTVQATTSLQDIIDPLTGDVDLVNAVKTGAIHAIQQYEYQDGDRGTKVKVKLYDAQTALQTIWKNQRVIDGLPTEVIAVLPTIQEIAELLTASGRSASMVFDKMLQRLHAERANKPVGTASG